MLRAEALDVQMEPSNMSQHITVTCGRGKEGFDIVNGLQSWKGSVIQSCRTGQRKESLKVTVRTS